VKLRLYSVFDSKAEAWLPTFSMRTDGEAVRGFTDEVNRGGSGFNAHPEDYTLFRVGEFDQSLGTVLPEVAPVPLMPALQAVLPVVAGKVQLA